MNLLLFSPVRTGSTLLFNVLKKIYTYKIYKLHYCKLKNDYKYVVISYRNPLDSILSIINTQKKEITNDSVVFYTNSYLKCGGETLIKNFRHFKQQDKILLLKYENFYNNYEHMYEKFEKHLNIKITAKKRKEMTDELCVKSVLKKIDKFASFNEFDKETHYHGLHISKNKGNTNQYKIYFTDEQIKSIKCILFEKLGNEYLNFMKQNNY